MSNQQSVVVTGVSTGIGFAIAQVLTAANIRVFGSVRNQADVEYLKKTFNGKVVPLLFDVTDVAAVKAASDEVRDRLGGLPLLGLVNNAGAGSAGPLLHVPLSEFRQQLEVNLLNVIQHFAPLLHSTHELPAGRIVNIGSTASRIGIPFMGAYSASKHGLEGLSAALRRELMIYGIDVITVIPGPVKTAIWDRAEELDLSAYNATRYGSLVNRFLKSMIREGRKGLEPKLIGAAVLTALAKKRPRPLYVVVPNRLKDWMLPTMLPTRLVDKLIGKQFGILKGNQQ